MLRIQYPRRGFVNRVYIFNLLKSQFCGWRTEILEQGPYASKKQHFISVVSMCIPFALYLSISFLHISLFFYLFSISLSPPPSFSLSSSLAVLSLPEDSAHELQVASIVRDEQVERLLSRRLPRLPGHRSHRAAAATTNTASTACFYGGWMGGWNACWP